MFQRPIYIDKILPFIDTPLVKVLTGVRRSGKSTIMKMLIDILIERGINTTQIQYYSFDSLKYESIRTAKDLYTEVKFRRVEGQKSYLFFDEIQEVQSWETAVNSLLNLGDVDIFVTGSNSRMMSSEIATYLTGRYVSFRIYPLSFSEFLNFRSSFADTREVHSNLITYLKFGGFPVVHLRDYAIDDAYAIVKDIYNATIFTDIVRRNQIRKVDQLERIVRFVFDDVGRSFSAGSIAKYFKNEQRSIDIETIYSYLVNLESAYIIHRCARFDVQGKEILKSQEKFYLADSAFRYSVLGYSADSVAAMLENLVYLELRRRGYEVFVGKLDQAEIDFVATKLENKLYIQVTQQIGSEETELKEYGRLLSINDNYPKYVLRADDYAGGNYEGIKIMHIADFLLSDEY